MTAMAMANIQSSSLIFTEHLPGDCLCGADVLGHPRGVHGAGATGEQPGKGRFGVFVEQGRLIRSGGLSALVHLCPLVAVCGDKIHNVSNIVNTKCIYFWYTHPKPTNGGHKKAPGGAEV